MQIKLNCLRIQTFRKSSPWVIRKTYAVQTRRFQGQVRPRLGDHYSRSPTYEPSSCELSKMRTYVRLSNHVRREWNCSLHSVSYCWRSFSSTISHLLSLLQSVTLLSCSLDASPVCQLLYCTTVLFKVLYCTIRFKLFSLFFVFFLMYCLCEKYYKPITVQYYIADCISWVPRLCWAYGQTRLTNALQEWNAFVCMVLTVLPLLPFPATHHRGCCWPLSLPVWWLLV